MPDDEPRKVEGPVVDPAMTVASEPTPDATPRATDPVIAVGPGPVNGSLSIGDRSLLDLLDRLAGLLERSDLIELEVQAGGTSLVLRKPRVIDAASVAPGDPPGAVGPGSPGASGRSPGGAPSTDGRDRAGAPGGGSYATRAVLAPLTGIYYASPTPASAPFVQAGSEVVVGQVIGLIEAMKLFNEIKSDLAGRVVRVVADNGTLVKAKQPLIEVEPL